MKNESTVKGYEDFAERVTLGQVLTESCSAKRIDEDDFASANMLLSLGVASTGEAVFYKLEAKADLQSEAGKSVGQVEVAIVTRYDINGGKVPAEDVLTEFGDREALKVAYPYAREAIQSLAARIGFTAVIVPFLGPTSDFQRISEN